MRAFALLSGGLLVFAAQQAPTLPAPLARHYATLAATPGLTVVYSVQTIGEAKLPYKLVLSRPGMFRLDGPTGFVVSDGKTVTTYKAATKSYTEEPYSEAWATAFAKRPDVLGWGGYLLKEPTADIAAARLGAARTVMGNATTEVEVTPKKGMPVTLFLDKKLGIARGWDIKGEDGKETLVTATTITPGKEALPSESFAFVAPEGATKAVAMAAGSFADVNALIQDRCMPCHGGGQPRAGINLASYDGILKTVTPGDPKGSLLVKSVRGDGVKKMPLGNHPALSEAEIKVLETWISAGAKP